MEDLKKKIKKFRKLETKEQVADLFETKWSKMAFVLYRLHESDKYKEFSLSKRNGKTRTISSPCNALKFYQKQLNEILGSIYRPKPFVNGFCNNKSILDNAKPHKNKRFVLNVDIESFFDSINFGRIRGLFKSKPFEFNDEVATVLSQIVCFKNKLPQGSPTSPILSNMICWRLDNKLFELAKSYNLIYTRYADDITFSTYLNEFPIDIADYSGFNKVEIGEKLERIFRNNGFKINKNKVRLQTKYHRQEVTGLIVNKFPNVNRKYIRNVRAMLHAWEKFGYEKAAKEYFKKYNKKQTKVPITHFEKVVRGKLEFIGSIKGKDNSTYLNLLNKAISLNPKLFKVENELSELYNRYLELKNLKVNGKKITKQNRGFHLEKLTNDIFNHFKIPVTESFKRNEGGEQIDGAFQFNNWFYLTELKWTAKNIDTADLDSLKGKIGRSGKQTLGFCISINGWSENVIPLLKQNKEKDTILMNGEELENILKGKMSLNKVIGKKIESLNLKAEPYIEIK
jgi:RNA-directed DNA polymerase